MLLGRNEPKKEKKRKRKEKQCPCSPDLFRFTLVFLSPNWKNAIMCGEVVNPQWKKKGCIWKPSFPEGWNCNISSQIHKGQDSVIRKMQLGFPPGIRESLALDHNSEGQGCWELYKEKTWIKSASLTNWFVRVCSWFLYEISAAHALSCCQLPKTIMSVSGLPKARVPSRIWASLVKTLDAQAGIELAREERLILPRNKNPTSVTHQLDVDSISSYSNNFQIWASTRLWNGWNSKPAAVRPLWIWCSCRKRVRTERDSTVLSSWANQGPPAMLTVHRTWPSVMPLCPSCNLKLAVK